MADIKRYPGIRHFRGAPTRHVIHLSRGTVRNAGTGLSFWYRPLTSVLSELPIDDREIQLIFRARTSDFQEVAVQATLTFRFADPEMASTRLDFAIDPDTGAATTAGLDQVTQILTELAQGHAVDVLAGAPLATALTDGLGAVRQAITAGLAGEERLATTGIAVLGVRVLSIRPEADVERALRTPAREAIQSEADRATYDRRATAVDMERAIAENELGNKIELATREQQLVVQEGANARRTAQEQAAAEGIRAIAAAERTQVTTVADAARIRDIGSAEGERERAAMAAFDGVDRSVLMALALRDLAQNLPAIGSLTVTPDLITGMLGRLFGGGGAGAEAEDLR